jgi:hypothetical protein
VALGDVEASARPEVRQLSTETTWRDTIGGWRVRWGIGRKDYPVKPGLYRVGTPGAESRVLVTANYKLTVDMVRSHLAGLNVWLLVPDTKGINVWRAAGKGTFGTGELAGRIASVGLAGVVRHRNLIVPQLGATGVVAHEVKRATGFTVHYGPVRASDIPAYLAAGMRATPAMRRVRFGWRERLVLAPVELVGALKPLAMVVAAFLALTLIRNHRLTGRFAVDGVPFIAAVLTGGVPVPLLLPWLLSRYFVLKGAVAGIVVSMVLRAVLHRGIAETVGTMLLVVAVTSYMAMMFTGSTTFTTLAGARLEVRRALPPILASAAIGAILRVVAILE